MALTAPARYSNRVGASLTGQNPYRVKNAVRIYHGALVGIDPNSGYIQNWSSGSAALIKFLGLAMPLENSVLGDTAASPIVECPVNESGQILEGVTVAGAVAPLGGGATGRPGVPVYATDENTFTVTATSNVGAVGRLVRCTSAGVGDVQLFSPMEYLALESLGKV
jgi:hypothetical protein